MVWPAMSVLTLLVLVIPKLVLMGMVTVAWAVLLAGAGSIVPMGAVTVARLTCVPTPPAVARRTTVTLLLAGNVNVPLNCEDETVDTVRVPPLAPVALSSTMPNRPLGKVSRTVALITPVGPRLRTMRVNDVVCPSRITVGVADFEMLRSACGPILTTAVPVLLPGLVSVVPAGGAIVAVLTTAPTVPATACKTIVSVLATGSVAVPLKAVLVVT